MMSRIWSPFVRCRLRPPLLEVTMAAQSCQLFFHLTKEMETNCTWRNRNRPTYEGKLDHLLESDVGSVFCLHARSKPISSLWRQIDRISIVVILVGLVVWSAKVDAKLVDEAVVDLIRFTFVSACKRHVAEQVPSRGFLLKEEIGGWTVMAV